MKLAAAHRVLMQTPGLQHAFSSAPAPNPPPAWLVAFVGALGRALVAAAPVLKIVFWAGVAAGAAAIVWMVVRDLPFAARFRRKRPAEKPRMDWRPEAAVARALIEEADQLAAADRFDEAIHLILFRSIEDIAKRRPDAVRTAFTSRDIVAAAPLSDAGRAAFRRIAEAVEHSFFAGRPAGRADYDACRGEYRAFALAETAP